MVPNLDKAETLPNHCEIIHGFVDLGHFNAVYSASPGSAIPFAPRVAPNDIVLSTDIKIALVQFPTNVLALAFIALSHNGGFVWLLTSRRSPIGLGKHTLGDEDPTELQDVRRSDRADNGRTDKQDRQPAWSGGRCARESPVRKRPIGRGTAARPARTPLGASS